ncbi:ovoinhibitor-like [Liolophura sinensis]|uniref:ovoinhibitor-like n=1 Tax=Liolophura sinensis TaxID=3198878 RepID=UPI00315892D8
MRALIIVLVAFAAAVSAARKCPNTCWKLPREPVCGSNGVTFRNYCALVRRNCMQPRTKEVTLLYDGTCVNYDLAVPRAQDPQPEIRYRPMDCSRYPGPKFAPCPNLSDPTCGNDLKTYPNECRMCRTQKEGLVIRHKGRCTTYEMALTGESDPNAVSKREIAPLALPRQPNCRDAFVPCSHTYGSQVCASDGMREQTFASECVLCSHWRKASVNGAPLNYLITKVGGIC